VIARILSRHLLLAVLGVNVLVIALVGVVVVRGSTAHDAAPAQDVALAVTPGRLSTANTFTITGLQAGAVRLLSQSLDMNMGILPYDATALGHGHWQVPGLFAPMQGRWGLSVQTRHGAAWTTVRQFVYQVPLTGSMRPLTAGSFPDTAQSNGLGAARNQAFALKLPYTALVTEMGSNVLRRLGGPALRTGVQPHGVDVLDGTPYAYVTNFGVAPGTVSQVDMRTMRVVRTFTVGLGPAHVVFTPDHRRAFVTDFRSNDLYALDLRTGATQQVTFPGDNCFEPHGIDISEDGHTLYVACAGGAWIATVDARTLAPGRMVVTGPGAFGVAVNGPRHEVWVTNQTANDVTVLDERSLRMLATIPVGKGPALLVPTPDGRKVYVADQLGNTVSVIDAASRRILATIPVAAQPHGPDVTADGKYVYVASIGGNAVSIISTSDDQVVAVIPAATGSNEVAIAH
jgi:YVTN family beta-propeller protein